MHLKLFHIFLLFFISSVVGQDCCEDVVHDILTDFSEAYKWAVKKFGKQYIKEIDFEKQDYDCHPTLKLKPDFIIVGSGTAASVLANRLTENPKWTVLVIEAGKGPDVKQEITSLEPVYYGSKYDYGYSYEKQKNFGLAVEDGRLRVVTGKVVGGSSVLDAPIFARPNLNDFKKLQDLDVVDWCDEDIIKYFKKLEKTVSRFQDDIYRGRNGSVTVEMVATRSKASGIFVKASQDIGHDYIDYNGRKQVGVSFIQSRTKRGRRLSAEKAYLRPIRHRKNLHIWTQSAPLKVMISGDVAKGVEIKHKGRTFEIIAKKEVLVAAEAFNSAKLLMLSGIGPKAELQRIGVKVIKDLPVGKTLGNTLQYFGLFISTKPALTRIDCDFQPSQIRRLIKNGTGSLTSLYGREAILYAQSPESKHLGPNHPDLRIIFTSSYLRDDLKAKIFQCGYNISEKFEHIYKPLVGRDISAVIPQLLIPSKPGYLTLSSADPLAPPKLYGNFLSDEKDVKKLVWAVRLLQMLVASKTYQKYEAKLIHIKIPTCSFATYDSEEYWSCAFRHASQIYNNPVGTCRMGTESEENGVVSSSGHVHGIENLRVVGAEIFPFFNTGDQFVLDAVIAEKIADLIKNDHGDEEE